MSFQQAEDRDQVGNSDVDLDLTVPEAVEQLTFPIEGNESSNTGPATTIANFREDEDEYVQMEVENENKFLSNVEDESDEEEEGEISFNNNALRAVEVEETIAPVPEDFIRLQKKEEAEKDREARIISKTV